MNIAVVGLGSMGKRRIRIIRELYPMYKIIGIDGRDDRRQETTTQFSIECYRTLDECNCSVDCVFVCSAPLSHNAIIHNALINGCHVFTELNLVSDGYDENLRLAKEKKLKLFLSSTFLYRDEIRYIRDRLNRNIHWNYIYHIGQYLPDWHPWENYKDFFLGDKSTNGCREILAIELPWLIKSFGEAISINVIGDKMTELNIDYKDNFIIQLTHENGNKGCLIVDVVSPVAVRNLEIYREGEYISWNGTPDSLREYNSDSKKMTSVQVTENIDHMEGYCAFVVENAYKNEVVDFFDVIANSKEPLYSFDQDLKILGLIDRIGA